MSNNLTSLILSPEEKAFESAYNGAIGLHNPGSVRWALRGYLPPKHLRIPGYNYGKPEDSDDARRSFNLPEEVSPKESIAEIMRGVFDEARSGTTHATGTTYVNISPSGQEGAFSYLLLPSLEIYRGSQKDYSWSEFILSPLFPNSLKLAHA